MKKIVTILTMAFIFLVCGTTVIAAQSGRGKNSGQKGNSGCGKGYVDEDGDGICDNKGRFGCGKGRFGCGKGRSGCGKGYVDEDGDGVCDNMKYTIKYNLNGGKNNKKNPSYYYNTTKTINLKKPTRKGYTFKGWYADKKCQKKVTAIKKGSCGKKKLYAKWQKK